VHPVHGAVISSIVPAWLDRNILWRRDDRQPQSLDGRLGPAGRPSIDTFDQNLLLGGWFPMFPTVGPPGACADLWMHGEAPRIPWRVISRRPDAVELGTTTPISVCQLVRKVTVRDNQVSVAMHVTNNSGRLQKVDVGEHPCFPRDLFAGGSIAVDTQTAATRSIASPADSTLSANARFSWPGYDSDATRDLAAIPLTADGRHEHIVLAPVAGRATLTGPAVGAAIGLEWDVLAMPNIMLWEHFRPKGSSLLADVLAIEPSSTAWRTHEETEANGETVELAAGESMSYWMRLTVMDTR
jgi:galactose mutarotase-like enzyme